MSDQSEQSLRTFDRIVHELSSKRGVRIGSGARKGFGATKSDREELAVEIALFVYHLRALAALIKEQRLSRASVATGNYLQLLMTDRWKFPGKTMSR